MATIVLWTDRVLFVLDGYYFVGGVSYLARVLRRIQQVWKPCIDLRYYQGPLVVAMLHAAPSSVPACEACVLKKGCFVLPAGSGPIPSALGRLTGLQDLRLFGNNLTGE